jgi:hypothetical protein
LILGLVKQEKPEIARKAQQIHVAKRMLTTYLYGVEFPQTRPE